MKFETKFGLGEIVIRESHKNGVMVQERMMEVIGIVIEKRDIGFEFCYVCEDTVNGHRQGYSENQIVGDKDFDQETGAYPAEILDTNAG